MKEKLKYLLPGFCILALIIMSSCRQNNDLAYYYNANSTGAGNGSGNGGCGCCGCCNGNSDNNASTDTITPFCEPDAPQTTFCNDGTITINAYKGVNFATWGKCPIGEYTAVVDGIMHLAPLPDGRELHNSADEPLLWIETGASTPTVAEMPLGEDSITILPDGKVLGYIGSVSTTLGKLIVVSQPTIGNCGYPVSPAASVGSSILWCGERVCVKKRVGTLTLVPVIKLAQFTVDTFDSHLILSQAGYHSGEIAAPDLYIKGYVKMAFTDLGDLVEATSCMPVKSKAGTAIALTAAPETLAIGRDATVRVNRAIWDHIAVVNVLNFEDLVAVNIPSGVSTGIKMPVLGPMGYVTINLADADPAVLDPVAGEENVCTDNPLQGTLELPR